MQAEDSSSATFSQQKNGSHRRSIDKSPLVLAMEVMHACKRCSKRQSSRVLYIKYIDRIDILLAQPDINYFERTSLIEAKSMLHNISMHEWKMHIPPRAHLIWRIKKGNLED